MSEKEDKIKKISDESIENDSIEDDIVDLLERTEEDREFYRLHSEPHQMEIDQRILGKMAPLSFMGLNKEKEEERSEEDMKNIFAVDGILYTSTEEDLD